MPEGKSIASGPETAAGMSDGGTTEATAKSAMSHPTRRPPNAEPAVTAATAANAITIFRIMMLAPFVARRPQPSQTSVIAVGQMTNEPVSD
jgi:hypothetical protein